MTFFCCDGGHDSVDEDAKYKTSQSPSTQSSSNAAKKSVTYVNSNEASVA